jgi:site-specific recombinase XerC
LVMLRVDNVPPFSAPLRAAVKRAMQWPREQHFKFPLTPLMLDFIMDDDACSVAVRTAVALMYSAGLRVHECVHGARAVKPHEWPHIARRSDVSMAGDGSHFTFFLRHSKADTTNSGFTVVAAALRNKDGSEHGACPVAWMQRLLARRPTHRGAVLFMEEDGSMVTRTDIARAVKRAASACGQDPKRYSTHSLRVGAATTLATNGATPEMLRTWGRWTSEACVARYVRLTPQRQALIAAALVQ